MKLFSIGSKFFFRQIIYKMKNIITTFTLALLFANNLIAQNFMTNAIETCKLDDYDLYDIRFVMNNISNSYGIRICTERPIDYKQPNWPKNEQAYTNSTFQSVFATIMGYTTNITWRYENSTDSIYVYPATNAITMLRVGPISLTNEPAWKIFYEYDGEVEIRKIEGFDLGGRERDDWRFEISLEIEEAYLWEVLDAILVQFPGCKSWDIREIPLKNGQRYELRYFCEWHAESGRY